MGNHKGDETKQPVECKEKSNKINCPYIVEVGGGFDGEQYECPICGERIYLDYEEMK